MERLTNKKEADAQRRKYEKTPENGYLRNIPEERFLKLAAYEATGLEPEDVLTGKELAEVACAMNMLREYQALGPIDHLREIAQAEKDGRLVVLPCKLHESIFYLEDGSWCDDVPYDVYIGQKQGGRNDSLLYECEGGFSFYEEEVGEIVFLTREEAEAALKKREGDNEKSNSNRL